MTANRQSTFVAWDSPHECLFPACPRCGEAGTRRERAARRKFMCPCGMYVARGDRRKHFAEFAHLPQHEKFTP